MKKRTVVTLLFYFFFITNGKHTNGQKSSTTSVGDFIADMVKSFALSGEDGHLSLGKGDKGKNATKGNQQNVISAMLTKLLTDQNPSSCTESLDKLNKYLPSSPKIGDQCHEAFKHLICDPLSGTHNLTLVDALKNLLLHSPLGKMIDSWNKLPTRLLLGNLEWIGAYDECSSAAGAKYCLSDFNLGSFGGNQTLHYGSCWPETCSTNDVVLMITQIPIEIIDAIEIAVLFDQLPEPYKQYSIQILKMCDYAKSAFETVQQAHDRTLCDNYVDYYTPGWQATLTIIAIFALACIIGTTIESVQEFWRYDPEVEDDGQKSETEVEDAGQKYETDVVDEKPKMHSFKVDCGVNNAAFTTQFSTAELVRSQSESKLDTTRTIEYNDSEPTFRSPVAYKNSKNVQGSSCNYLLDFFLCFSILRNARTIFCTKVPGKTVKCLNGIRVISFTWVILGNYYGWMGQKMKTDNLKTIVFDKIYDLSFMVVSNAYVSVDTFFLLSGFLTAYLSLKKYNSEGMNLKNVLQGYLHRYIRITPCLGLVFLMYFFLPQILRGPKSLFITQTDEMASGVKDYWWAGILYINNFYPSMEKSGSISWSFYLSNDMQFFLIAPLILFVVIRIDRSQSNKTAAVLYNFLFLFSICLASFLTTALITLGHGLPSVATSALLPIENSPYNTDTFEAVVNEVYLKPYCRITPYIVGIFLGYLFVNDIKPAPKGMGRLITATGWISAVIGALTVVYGPWRIFAKNAVFFTDAERGLYTACHRFVWGTAVAWVIYACHYKRGGIINTILSWPVWVPLSRLTFAAYLMHFEVIYTFTLLKEIPIHYQTTEIVFAFIPIVVITYVGAFVLAVCVEYPLMNVEKYVKRVFFRN